MAIVRPDEDVSVTGWSPLPVWPNLDEVTPDEAATEVVTTIPAAGGNRNLEVGLTPGINPGVDTGHTVRIRAKTNAPLDVTIDSFVVKQGGVDKITVIGPFTFDLADTYETKEIALDPGDVAALTDYTALSILFTFHNVALIAVQAWVTWIELQLPSRSSFVEEE